MPWESWVERRLREARDRGAFEDLAGLGKPLEIRDHDAMTWVRDKARQEGLPITALLPPSLAVAKEVEDLPFKLARERSEAQVRALLTDLNRRIDGATRTPDRPSRAYAAARRRGAGRRLAGRRPTTSGTATTTRPGRATSSSVAPSLTS